jgi:ABC-type nitrate/sulfonate/bicarbonate transport system substrate-binding protein
MLANHPFALRFLWALFVLSVPYSGAQAQELRRIHYGTTSSTAHLPIWVAKDAGYFAKNGLNVEPVNIRGGANNTMGSNRVQKQVSGAGAESH